VTLTSHLHLVSRLGMEVVVFQPPTYLVCMVHNQLSKGTTLSFTFRNISIDHLCGLVARVPGYRSRCPGSIPGATRFYEK
jgi:hypothetical protein